VTADAVLFELSSRGVAALELGVPVDEAKVSLN
jgi:hypothetical protein